ncbi:hypothetical protein GCM10022393_16720 [Aquimarina addita]|uniref:BPP domain-containing protein n=1 Tax=Aquimarina addita TaxID=870485 RepID=A0ABP7XHB6_9FLAO
MKKFFLIFLLGILFYSCTDKLPTVPATVVSEKVPHDTDDPAIWVHPTDASKSIVFGTDKDTDGAIYAFNLQGKIIPDKVLKNIRYPNNIDIEYGFKMFDSTVVDIMVFTERERNQIRLFSVPDMRPLDGGGFPVFEDETNINYRRPMGVGIYKNPINQKISVIVSRKTGPKDNYLYQYELISDAEGVRSEFIRKFGKFSGVKEIEAIAIDDELGHVYCSDEGVGIRKYAADPSKGNEELAFFGNENFSEDMEGIAIAAKPNGDGWIIVSDQQKGQFNIFSRKDHHFIKAVNLGTTETDGCDLVIGFFDKKFPKGLFVAMNNQKDFYFYDLGLLGFN